MAKSTQEPNFQRVKVLGRTKSTIDPRTLFVNGFGALGEAIDTYDLVDIGREVLAQLIGGRPKPRYSDPAEWTTTMGDLRKVKQAPRDDPGGRRRGPTRRRLRPCP